MAADDSLVREAHHVDPTSYQYPFATSPDIIRSHQKDAYFQGVLLEQLSTVLRKLYGSRFAQTYTTEARTSADLLYLGLTTFVGNRTLGEEYCDVVQVEDSALKLPSISTRSAYILTTILLPYSLNRMLPILRQFLRARLEPAVSTKPISSFSSTLQTLRTYLLTNLDTLTSPAPIYAASLATFYFTGAYYHLSKRLLGLRYIFTRQPSHAEQANATSYEVLGVLLVLQLAVQSYIHLHSTISTASAAPPSLANASAPAGRSAALNGSVEVSLDPTAYTANNAVLFESGGPATLDVPDKLAALTHTPLLQAPRYDLHDADTMQWIAGRQARKCTLCLEEMRDPSITTCGHAFCWTCIFEWCRDEKPECPLCRQVSLAQHILPLRG